MATKFGMDDEVGDPYPCAKFYHYPIRGFRCPPQPSCMQIGHEASNEKNAKLGQMGF